MSLFSWMFSKSRNFTNKYVLCMKLIHFEWKTVYIHLWFGTYYIGTDFYFTGSTKVYSTQFSTTSSIGLISMNKVDLLPVNTDFSKDTHTMCENMVEGFRKNDNVFKNSVLQTLIGFLFLICYIFFFTYLYLKCFRGTTKATII